LFAQFVLTELGNTVSKTGAAYQMTSPPNRIAGCQPTPDRSNSRRSSRLNGRRRQRTSRPKDRF
jgi:hypothetical protein